LEVSDQLQAPVALPQGNNPDIYLVGGWVDNRSGSDV